MKRFTSLALLVGIVSRVSFQGALPPEISSFSPQKIEPPSLGLVPPPPAAAREVPPGFAWSVPPSSQEKPTLGRDAEYKLGIITPDATRDYKLIVKAPDPLVDYKMTIRNVGPGEKEEKK